MSGKKINVPNPLSLISLFSKKDKPKPEYEFEVEKDDKKASKKKRKGVVDFDEEMSSLGFSFVREKDNYRIFRYVAIPTLIVFWNTKINDVSVYYEKKLLSKINFVPNNRLFIEIFIKKTIENL